MYEVKKIGKLFTSKSVGTGPSSYKKKKNLPGRGLTKVEKHWSTLHSTDGQRLPSGEVTVKQVWKCTCRISVLVHPCVVASVFLL